MQNSKAFGSLIYATMTLVFHAGVTAQFSSGSTGADGALDLSEMNCPNNVCRVQLSDSGVLNYTTITVPAGKTLRFVINARNTPAILLAQGQVVINGRISVSALGYFLCGELTPEELGPGGFRGGQPGRIGFGPGGGQTNYENGRWVGPLSLFPLVGGSGGAGSVAAFWAWPGGNGGGAIAIASSVSITGNGSIDANGSAQGNCANGGSSGSGGAIRFVANSINFSGSLSACSGNCGVVRLEANQMAFTGTSNPAAVLAPVSPGIVSGSPPQLTIVSVAGYQVPSYAGSRFDTVDVLLPNQIPDPVNVVVQAVNIPSGTQVNVGFVSGSPSGTSTPCTLSGGPGPLSCTATVSNLNRSGVTYLLATAAFDPPASIAGYNPRGPNQVAKVRVESIIGGSSKYVFLDSKGGAIDTSKISREFLAYFGVHGSVR